MSQAFAPRLDSIGGGWLERSLATDRTTGLAGRSAFDEMLAEACATGAAVSVLILHVSGAATVRSRYGSGEADRLMSRAGAAVRAALRGSDFAARFDDDDIGVILPGAGLEDTLRIARRIAHDTERRNSRTAPNEPPVFFAFGAASGRGCNPVELADAADPRKANAAPDATGSFGGGGVTEDDGPSVA